MGPTDIGNLMSSYGRGMAATNLENQQAGLVQQQTQGAAMQNELMKARMPLIIKALQDFSVGPQDDSNASAFTDVPAGHNPFSQAQAQEGAAPNAGDEPWYDPGRIDAGLRSAFYVNPAGTSRDMKNIVQAGLSGDQGLLEAAKAQRDIGTAQRLAESQNKANRLYESMSGVANAPEGRALDALEALSPSAAEAIRKQIPDGMIEDEAARKYAAHVASTVHQYSGRPVKADTGGVFRDEVTGQPVTGVESANMSAKDWTDLATRGMELQDQKNSDNSITQVPRYQLERPKDVPPDQWTLRKWIERAAGQRSMPGASPTLSGAPSAQASGAAQAAAAKVQSPSAPPPRQPPPRGGAPTPPPAPGTVPLPGTPPPGAPAMVPGLDLATLPKTSAPPVVAGRTASIDERTTQEALAKERVSVLKDAKEQSDNGARNNALLSEFQEKLNKVNPRDVGPSSPAYKALLDLKTFISGKAPNDLVDMGVLDKFANQLGVQNIRSLLSGQRITNQEMMTFLTRASASVTQPIDVMKSIIAWQKANNDYDRMAGFTKIRAMQAPYLADPYATPGIIENGRADYVHKAMGIALGAPQPKPLPTGDKLTHYAKQYHGGDEAKAVAYLKTQGYGP